MPVWHELTREWREAEALAVVGLASEQHPDRCRLFARWQRIDWPILADPFNLTGSRVVPTVVAVDEHGVVRAVDPDPETFAEEFLEVAFPAPVLDAGLGPAEGTVACAYPRCPARSVAWPLPGPDASADEIDAAVRALEERLGAGDVSATLAFRAGVAYRMRHDSAARAPGDFQAAVDHWTRALEHQPGQYVWRRRIQQYGPRMDKPYAFYDWVEEAHAELVRRGEEPPALAAALTPAERAEPAEELGPADRRDGDGEGAPPAEPDPGGGIPRDEAGLVALETAVAFDTSPRTDGEPVPGRDASVHLAFHPDALRDVHWNHETGAPLRVWLAEVEGLATSDRLLEVPPRADTAVSEEPLRLTLDARLAKGVEAAELGGYALYSVCEGAIDAGGRCVLLRRDFTVRLERP